MRLIFVSLISVCVVFLSGCGLTGRWSPEKMAKASERDLWQHWWSADFDFANEEAAKTRDELLRRENTSAWEAEQKEAVEKQQIMRGMTERQVILSWGPPTARRVSSSPYGQIVEYQYVTKRADLTFHDGALSWWHIEGR